MINETTSHLGIALPHPSNTLEDDVLRLRSAINAIDAKFALLDTLLASNDASLDTIQELVNSIKADATALSSHVGAGGAVHAAATGSVAGFMSATDKTALDGHLGSGGAAHTGATGSVAGFMSAADKTKLDGVTYGILFDTVEWSPATDGDAVITVSGGYTAGSVMLFMNGSKLKGSDFTATNGTSITLATGALTTDEFEIVRFKRALSA